MKAIETYYLQATSTKPTRIKAVEPDGIGITMPWDHGIDADANHRAAQRALCDRLGWTGNMIGGHTKRGMVWVFLP